MGQFFILKIFTNNSVNVSYHDSETQIYWIWNLDRLVKLMINYINIGDGGNAEQGGENYTGDIYWFFLLKL